MRIGRTSSQTQELVGFQVLSFEYAQGLVRF